MLQKVTSWVIQKEKYFFLTILLINISFLFVAKFYPSMDGPAHLHNSYLLKQLINGSQFLDQYYSINTVPIPNWTNHFVLTFLLTFFSPDIVEKLAHVIYIIIFSVSFRYFIKQIQPQNVFGAIVVFPFLFSFLMHLGFLNFCYSIGFMFLSIGYYVKHQNNMSVGKSIFLSSLILITYLSNAIGFAYLLFFIFSICCVNFFNSKKEKIDLLQFINKSVRLLLISLLPLVCLTIFYSEVSFSPSTFKYKNLELIDWILDFKSIIIYNYYEDKKYTQLFFMVLLAAFSVAAFNFYKNEQKTKFTISFVFLVSLVITFVALIKIPDGSSAGMMSDRFSLMLCFLFLATLLSFPVPRSILFFIVSFSIVVSYSLFFKNHKTIIENYSNRAEIIYNASSKINNKSIVLPIKMEGDWLEGHFSNYLGIDKELVILENYEAKTGWFPLKWNNEKLPKFVIGSKQNIGGMYWTTNNESNTEKKIDYVFLYGNTSLLNDSLYRELKSELDSNYVLEESIKDSYVRLFKLKK